MPPVTAMPTDSFSLVRLLLWIAVGFVIVGCATAVAYQVHRQLRRTREKGQAETRLQDARRIEDERARQRIEQELRTARRALALQTELAAELNAKLEELERSNAERVPRLPLSTIPQSAAPDIGDRPQWEAKLHRFEASLAQARRNRDASDHNLKKAHQLNQQQAEKITGLTLQIGEVALNLEETRISLMDAQRELAEAKRREQAAEAKVAELHDRRRQREQQLTALDQQLAAQRDANLRIEQTLRQAQSTIHQWESGARSGAAEQDALTQQLQQKQSAYETLERMLQDATAGDAQLRSDLRTVALGREQLEIQNVELKTIVDQLCGRSGDFSVGTSQHQDAQDSILTATNVMGQWATVTDGDISDAVMQLKSMASVPPETEAVPGHTEQVEPWRKAIGSIPPPAGELLAELVRTEDVESLDLEKELREAKVRLHVLESGMRDLEYLREQNAKLREELSQDRGAARELTALQIEHKRMKLDLQLAEQKLESQHKTIESQAAVNMELQGHKAASEAMRGLQIQLRDLRAENFALRNLTSGTYRVLEPARPLQSDARELAATPLDAAVVSDHLGLPVAATGKLPAESMAAVSGLAAQIAVQVRELLPVGPIRTVQWIDQYGLTITCRLFELAGNEMAMTTLATDVPSEQCLKETLKTVLESIGWTEEGPQSSNAAAG
jgi:hypothetical protein